jgi:hypothetical protein
MSYVIDGVEHSLKKMVSGIFGAYYICYPESFGEEKIEDIMECYFDSICKVVGYENIRSIDSVMIINPGQVDGKVPNGKILVCKTRSVLEEKLERQTSTTV